MQIRFPAHFESLIDQLKKYLPPTSTEWVKESGAHNHFARDKLASTFVDHDRKSSYLPVAITQTKFKEQASSNCAAIDLLREKSKVSPDHKESVPPLDLTFIHTPLSYHEMIKFSKLGTCDIYAYNYTLPINIKEWCAQIIFALYELHRYNLVHLDIKPENIFLFLYSKLQHLKLGDLDTLTFENDPNIQIAGTPAQLAPEICYHWNETSTHLKQHLWSSQSNRYKISFWNSLSIEDKGLLWKELSSTQQSQFFKKLSWKQRLIFVREKIVFEKIQLSKETLKKKDLFWKINSNFNIINLEEYFKADKKKIDCYALGVTFSTILSRLGSKTINPLFYDLINRLILKNPDERWNIEQAKQHAFFGVEEGDRNKYFDDIKEKYKSTTFIDDYYVPTQHIPEKNDSFYILPLMLKEIYLIAVALNIQINSIKQIPDEKCLKSDFIKLTFWKKEKIYKGAGVFRQQPHFIRRKTNEYYTDQHTLIAIQEKAAALKEKSELFLKNGERLTVITELRAAAEEIIYTVDELLISYLASINNERLFNAVLNAEKTYNIRVKTLIDQPQPAIDPKTLPVPHNTPSFKKINRFVEEIQSMIKTHSPRQFFLHILTYLTLNKNDESFSFETVLIKELKSISQRPLNKWAKHLCAAVEETARIENIYSYGF